MKEEKLALNRWRLVLGKYSDETLQQAGGGIGSGESSFKEIDALLEFLYSREYAGRDIMETGSGSEGSLDPSNLTLVKWLNEVHRLFPKEAIEKIENHALEKYNLTGLLNDKRVLARLEPNMTLLKQILVLKDAMQPDVLETAHKVVEKVVDELRKKLETQMRQSIIGRKNKNESTNFKYSKNLDFKKTIRKNLKNYHAETKQLLIERVYFNTNSQRFSSWHIIVCVDESGSMMENVIHSAVMSAIFAKMPVLSTKLVIFDTNVVDLSEYIDDPVKALMTVQLGGGTDIGKALRYCEQLLANPNRTILVLVSDLCDGAGYTQMYKSAKNLVESGVRLMCLTSLDMEDEGVYDKTAAKILAGLGAKVAALTPFKLADWVGEVIKE